MIVNYPWYKRKHYLHFDLPLPESEALRYVANPKSIAQHAFYPFIAFELVTPRIRKSQNKKKYYRSPKRRPIAYPSHRDGYIFSYYKSLLEPLYEKWLKAHNLDECVTAFRKTGKIISHLQKRHSTLSRATRVAKYLFRISTHFSRKLIIVY